VVTFPTLADRLGPFALASETAPAASSADADRDRWRRDYVLEPEGAGALTVPALTVTVRDRAGAPSALATAPFAIAVTSLLPAEVDFAEYRDIAPPVELPPAGLAWLLWPAILLVVALAGFFLVWRRRRRRSAALLPAQPPHLLALSELERLARRLPADRPGTEEFYVRLAQILRHYVAGRFGLSAPTRTTEELLTAVATTGGPLAARGPLIGTILGNCDLVKFARAQPTPTAAPGNLHQARTFVEQTAEPTILVEPGAANTS
jgi:hypothetical protein